ncbi:hypothetical protein [Achromobacter xylosoxidans]|uniref:hypothetical protein n=1 Tax=Alcaligenes xylosoxydans xylosoxydans TaxID=85698 RepID=UPI002E136059
MNSAFGVGAARRDCFTDDDAVLAWLKLAGVQPASRAARMPPWSTMYCMPAAPRRRCNGTRPAMRTRWSGSAAATMRRVFWNPSRKPWPGC